MKKRTKKASGIKLPSLKIPSSYKYTAGLPSSSADGKGFKFIVDATDSLQKTFREAIPTAYNVNANATATVDFTQNTMNSILGAAGLIAGAVLFNAALNYAGRR